MPPATIDLGKPLTPRPTPSIHTVDNLEFVFGLVSPGVQDKIDQIEALRKRKSDGSPEVDELSRKEKKILRDEEKRQKKLEKKQESREKSKLGNKSY